ncbi:MAG TPA: glycoside hydrolase family 31 protein [Aggregatilineales bacterium]|nr:glycoside hydrolase family 31 protein [Aggregatilineales bacterium]
MSKKTSSPNNTSGERGPLAAARNRFQKMVLDRRYGGSKADKRAPFKTPGTVIAIEKVERGIVVRCDHGAIRLTVIAPDCIMVRFQESGKFAIPFSYSVAKVSWPDVQFTVKESDNSVVLSAPEISCEIIRDDATLRFRNAHGEPIFREAAPLSWHEGEMRVTRELPNDEQCFGLATQPVSLDLRGRRYFLWNTDPVGFDRGRLPTYLNVGFYLGVRKDRAVGIFWDNSSRGWVDVGAEEEEQLTFSAASGELRYYVFSGLDLMPVLNRYTELTGRMPMPPMWALGFHISRWSYYPADRVREIATGLRRRNIPCDAIYLDIHYMDGYRCFTWDRELFPAPAVLFGELAEQGFKVVTIIDPGIKVDAAYKVYTSGLEQDVFVKLPDGKPFTGPVWAGNSAFPDFTSPKARAWWASQFDALIRPGVSGIWNDMNEPTVFKSGPNLTIPDYAQHEFEGEKLTHAEAHNVYGMLMARASREALEKMRPNKRPFNLTRSGSAGTQRYASFWTADNRATWDHLKLSISMIINSGLTGMAFTGADIGGFEGNTEPELYTRWIQLGALLPYFRVHTHRDTGPHEPWAFGQPYEDICRKYINLRYEVLPYIYSLFAQNAQNGWPIIRPMFMADPADNRLRSIEDAFMVGDTLLVAPILEKGKTQRKILLPRGTWYDFYTNKAIQGDQEITVDAPLDMLPLYARAGQVIPLWPVQQYIGQKKIEELHLKVFAGSGEVTLYEDAGEGTDYLNGVYRWLYFTCKRVPTGGIEINWRRAGKYNPPYDRVRCEVYGIDIEPRDVQLDNQSAPLWYYEKGVVEFTANKPFDTAVIIDADMDNPGSTLMRSPLKKG